MWDCHAALAMTIKRRLAMAGEKRLAMTKKEVRVSPIIGTSTTVYFCSFAGVV